MNIEPSIVFLDNLGRVLAQGLLQTDALLEGKPGEVKDVAVDIAVVAEGWADHYLCVTPRGETVRGVILEKRGNHARELFLDDVELKPGQRIEGRLQIETVED